MTERSNSKTTTTLIVSLCAGGLSALAGYGVAHHMVNTMRGQRWSDGLALAIAAGLLVLGILMLGAGLIDRLGRAMTRSEKLTSKMKRQHILQGVTMLLASFMMAAPPFMLATQGLSNDADPARAPILLGMIVFLFAGQTLINFDLWRTSDEFYRRAMLETSAISFWVLQGALFLWAVAERTGYAPVLQSWDAVCVLMAVYLVLSVVVTRRLGVE